MDKQDFIDAAKFVGIFAVGITAIITACMIPVYIADRWDCSAYEYATGRDTKYAGLQCYVLDDTGKYRAMDEMKIRNATKGE